MRFIGEKAEKKRALQRNSHKRGHRAVHRVLAIALLLTLLAGRLPALAYGPREEGTEISMDETGNEGDTGTGEDIGESGDTGDGGEEPEETVSYTVTILYNQEYGTVITDPVCQGGTVTVKEGEQVIIEAIPNPGYRVLSVKKNEEELFFTENHQRYEEIISEADKDYLYEISFALNTYKITVNSPENGTVLIDQTEAEHGGSARAVITPAPGYVTDTVYVNHEALPVTQLDNQQVEAFLKDITKDQYLEVSFKPVPVADLSEVSWNTQDAVRREKSLYVFPKGTLIVFSTEREGLKINGSGTWKKNIFSITETTTVTDIQIFYQGEEDSLPVWHQVKLPEGGIRIAIDESAPTVGVTPDEPRKGSCYNRDVDIAISAGEPWEGSGIKTVEYRVVMDGDLEHPTQSGSLLTPLKSKEAEEGFTAKPVLEWSGTLRVDAKKNNSCNIMVYITVTDHAGNKAENTLPLDIDVTPPVIRLRYDNNQDNDGNSYFNAPRRATVTITERTEHFDGAEAAAGIQITARDAKGRELPKENIPIPGSWVTKEGDSPDQATHTLSIDYLEDANYTFSITYEDAAGNLNDGAETGDSASPFRFTVDRTAPRGTIRALSREGREEIWDAYVDNPVFGFWSREQIIVSGTAEDGTSPLAAMECYRTEGTKALTEEDLKAVTEWEPFKEQTVEPNHQCVLYVRITDLAGNVTYISTDGLMVDNLSPRQEVAAPETSIQPERPSGGPYRENVKVNIAVEEPAPEGSCSGLKRVYYRVLNMGEETQSGILYSHSGEALSQKELQKSWNGAIILEAEKNNSNDVVVEILSEDNAGNSSRERRAFRIDVTKPEILVSFNNNSGESGGYYRKERTAVIDVTERNFDPEKTEVKITSSQGTVPTLSGWHRIAGSGNQDNTIHRATVTFQEDGDYTLVVTGEDMAGNRSTGTRNPVGTQDAEGFTIDRTLPVVTVDYDNNEAENGSYFKGERRATITVQERNFHEKGVALTVTGQREGTAIAVPKPQWTSQGDTHRAVLFFQTDGDYTLNVELKDLAGNESGPADFGNSVAGQAFTVDTQIPDLVITGVADGCAYRGEVAPYIEFSDINFSAYDIRLTRTRMFEKDVEVTKDFIRNIKVGEHGGGGTQDIFEKLRDNDGIYTLHVKARDKAGNEGEKTVTFSLNRFGSVYAYSDYLHALTADGGAYVPKVEKDFIITEYNADRLEGESLKIDITRDGKPLSEVSCHISPVAEGEISPGDSGWYQYKYTIAKENFDGDGIYKLSVSSRDEAGNTPENGSSGQAPIVFWVDSTAPEITGVTGLGQTIANASHVTVYYTVFDAMGLQSVQVYVDGKEYGEAVTDFSLDANHYAGSFVLQESDVSQRVRIVASDRAGNFTDTDEREFKSAYPFHRNITVSTNFLVRWYANRPVFWCSVGAVAAVALGISGICARRRKKRSA